MARTELIGVRRHNYKDLNIGQILIFCEGQTEKYYFDYFAEILNNSNKYDDIQVEIETATGNAQVVNAFRRH